MDGNVGTRVRNNLIGGILGRGQPPHWAGTVWGWAVYFSGNGNDIELTGNTIGLDVNGDPTLGSVWGIHTDNSLYTDVRIGGMGPGEGNVIAGHLLTGITIGRGNRGVRLAGNSIHSNATSGSGFLGIDLIGTDLATGVTPNDPLDEDLGGNGLQNYPVIATAVSEMGGTRIQGALDSAPNQTYTLEFFASPTCDPTGFGQGSTPLGFATVTTDSGGHAAFDVLVGTSSAGDFVSSTATLEPEGSTSEFSACVQTTGSTCATNIGFGGPGSSVLSLCGTPLGTGGSATLNLDSAPANEPVWITFGPTNNPTPLFGGTVVPVPGRTMFLGMTAADGTLSFGPILGGGGPATIYAQAAVRDPSIPTGFGISNAIEIQFLP
ncbi:MAG TPA: hypothetical protein ENJ09_05610 [Planctomycetes bacterium]|nr:hypothetical protein [Planctomycetota bacterium]